MCSSRPTFPTAPLLGNVQHRENQVDETSEGERCSVVEEVCVDRASINDGTVGQVDVLVAARKGVTVGRVEGKVAFITGAARGQGRSHAVRLAQEGANIVAIDVLDEIPGAPYPPATKEDLAETVRQVEALGRRIVATRADVRDFDQVKAALDDGVTQLGHLEIVCANAGITTALVPAEEFDEDTVLHATTTILTRCSSTSFSVIWREKPRTSSSERGPYGYRPVSPM